MPQCDIELLPKSALRETFGNSGTEVWSGFFSQDPNPKWLDQRRVDIVDEMRTSDGAVRSVLDSLKAPILAAETRIEPGSKSAKAKMLAEFVEKQLFNMPCRPFEDWLREALTHFDFGHSVFEKIWGMDDKGIILLKDLAPRVQSSIQQWEMTNGEAGIQQEVKNDLGRGKGKTGFASSNSTHGGFTYDIPRAKLVILTNDKEGDDVTGRSVIRSAYIHYSIKNRIYKISSIGVERNAIGLPTGTLPSGATQQEKDEFEELLKNIRANQTQYLVLPTPDYDFEFKTPSSNPWGSTMKDLIDHHNRMIFVSTMSQFLLLGGEGVGSLALSNDLSSFFLIHGEQKSKYIEREIDDQIIYDIVTYNFKDVEPEDFPRYKFGALGQDDFREMAEVFEKLINVGVIDPSEEKINTAIRKTFKLPEFEGKLPGIPEVPQKPEEKDDGGKIPEKKTEKEKVEGDDDAGDSDEFHELQQKKKLKFRRPLTDFEKNIDLVFLNEETDAMEAGLQAGLTAILAGDIETALRKLRPIVSSKNLNSLKNVSLVRTPPIKREVKSVSNRGFETGKKTASDELGVERPPTPSSELRLQNFEASETADSIKQNVEGVAKQVAKNGIAENLDTVTVMAAIAIAMRDTASQQILNASGLVGGGAIGRGRLNVFQRNITDISAFVRTEVLDNDTCNMCISLDGRIVSPDDPLAKLKKVHSSCRGEWVAVKTADVDKPIQDPAKDRQTTPEELLKSGTFSVPKTVRNSFDTVGGVPVVNNFKQLKKPINRGNAEAQPEIKRRLE